MEPFFRLIIRDKGGAHRWADDLNLADFGGIEPQAGDLYCRVIRMGSQRQQQTFRVLGRVMKDQRIGILAEWADNLPEDLIEVLEDR
jgi:hypothetical protein